MELLLSHGYVRSKFQSGTLLLTECQLIDPTSCSLRHPL